MMMPKYILFKGLLALMLSIHAPLKACDEDARPRTATTSSELDGEEDTADTVSYESADEEVIFELREAGEAYARISFKDPDALYRMKLDFARFIKGEDQPEDYLCHSFLPEAARQDKEVLRAVDRILTKRSQESPIYVEYPLLQTAGLTYDPGYSFGGITWLKQECLREARFRVDQGQTVQLLDAGCGHFYFSFPALLTGSVVTAVDQHPELHNPTRFGCPYEHLEKIQSVFPEKGLKERLTVLNEDLLAYLEGKENFFDLTYAGDVIHYQSCLKGASLVHKLHTATKPGGIVYACVNVPEAAAFEVYKKAKVAGKKFPGYYARNTMLDQSRKTKSAYTALDGEVDDLSPAYLRAGFHTPHNQETPKEKAKKLLVRDCQFTHRAVLGFDAPCLRTLFEEAGFVVIDLSYRATTGRFPENTVLSAELLKLIARVQIIALKPL